MKNNKQRWYHGWYVVFWRPIHLMNHPREQFYQRYYVSYEGALREAACWPGAKVYRCDR